MLIRRALLSVSDKTSLLDFATELSKFDIELISTGGTERALRGAGLAVTGIESYSGSPEVMDGRVKTLHPRVHGAILAREGVDDGELERLGGRFIDLVVVNLYPFEATAARADASADEVIEQIDIGGPSMLRSAAKNQARVTAVCDPADYALVLRELKELGRVSDATRRQLAAKVFAHTAAYDAAIAGWLSARDEGDGQPRFTFLGLEKAYGLRYGENPHQSATFYRLLRARSGTLARAESCGEGAKELSFNNLVDADAALEAVNDFSEPAAVIVKHSSPCGVACMSNLAAAYRAARDADSLSAFGGIVAVNRELDAECAEIIAETFIECVVAPSFSDAALTRLRQKKNLRLLATHDTLSAAHTGLVTKHVSGGLLIQDRDATGTGEVERGRIVTGRPPSAAERRALEFAWLACKHVKSNGIVLAQAEHTGYATVGIGGGQTSRVSAVRQAVQSAGAKATGSVLASDAFFPFPDGVEVAANAGVTAIVQPGGSKADEDVIAMADRVNIAMVFTGIRHFRH